MLNSLIASSTKEKRKEWRKIKAVLLLFLTGAVITDLCKDKIYNVWVIPGMITGLLMAFCSEPGRLSEALMTVVVTFLVLMPVYFLKGIAAGDVKLLLSTASFLSFQECYSCILYSFLIAGAISLVIIIFKREKKTLHFAVPVLISTILVMGGIV
ncbi:A24 family peptidase [Butyrivibrio sp. VCB2006]|uniref:A24 family peptidase n=1 Tax=Butyrivibrio sp. VCB2006 TaxID=1280679 RepID=UPI0004924C1C|nr:A24 family peptidase [Butyrivibrio sp. VCB2006]